MREGYAMFEWVTMLGICFLSVFMEKILIFLGSPYPEESFYVYIFLLPWVFVCAHEVDVEEMFKKIALFFILFEVTILSIINIGAVFDIAVGFVAGYFFMYSLANLSNSIQKRFPFTRKLRTDDGILPLTFITVFLFAVLSKEYFITAGAASIFLIYMWEDITDLVSRASVSLEYGIGGIRNTYLKWRRAAR